MRRNWEVSRHFDITFGCDLGAVTEDGKAPPQLSGTLDDRDHLRRRNGHINGYVETFHLRCLALFARAGNSGTRRSRLCYSYPRLSLKIMTGINRLPLVGEEHICKGFSPADRSRREQSATDHSKKSLQQLCAILTATRLKFAHIAGSYQYPIPTRFPFPEQSQTSWGA